MILFQNENKYRSKETQIKHKKASKDIGVMKVKRKS